MQKTVALRLKLLRQRALAAFRIGGNVPVAVEPAKAGATIIVDGRRIAAPSPLRWKLYRQGWEARLDRLEREYGVNGRFKLGAGAVILDIGANVGEFAHVGVRYGARVFCLEPDPAAFACLKMNIEDLTGASAHELLVWKSDGEVEFGLAPERADSSVFAPSAKKIRRRAVTVETFCREQSIARVDLLKCDAEGAEPEVLEGVGAFFPHLRAVALDTGAERLGARTHEACAAILEAQGFAVSEEKIGARWMTFGVNRRA